MSRPPLDINGGPPQLLPHTGQPAALSDVPSLTADINSSIQSPALSEFRQPTAPSSHGKRRARDDDTVSRTSSLPKKSKVSESTSVKSYREQLQEQYAGCCVCQVTYYLHAARVIDKAAFPDFRKIRDQGLVSLETIGDFDNAIYLCPADHAAFDASDPGLIIVPTYLDFFIEHEQRWQDEMRKSTRPTTRPPVLPSQYAAHCAIPENDPKSGLYTAYMVVDYKEKGKIAPPCNFQWHGDPGAIIWKARRLMSSQLSLLDLEPGHLQQLLKVREKLDELKKLQENGDFGRRNRINASKLPDDSTGDRPPPSEPSNYVGNGTRGDLSGSTNPPPPQSGKPAPADQSPYCTPYPTTRSAPPNTALCPELRGAKQKQVDLNLCDNNEDTLHIPVSEAGRSFKRVKRMSNDGASSQRHPENRTQDHRWGGSDSSTEDTVRYWNAIFGPQPRQPKPSIRSQRLTCSRSLPVDT